MRTRRPSGAPPVLSILVHPWPRSLQILQTYTDPAMFYVMPQKSVGTYLRTQYTNGDAQLVIKKQYFYFDGLEVGIIEMLYKYRQRDKLVEKKKIENF